MGLRGIDIEASIERRVRAPKQIQPWQKKGLSRAARVIAFCEDLTVSSGTSAGEKLKLRPFQRKFIQAVYAVDKNGKRPVRTAVLSMGRKNGKTQLAAALALCHLHGPEAEERGEVYSCANDRFQAGKVFNEMSAMVRRHKYLYLRCNVGRFHKKLEDLQNESIYQAVSAEASTKMGLNPSLVVYDELGQAVNRELYDAMDTALGARRNPLMLVISTQAAEDNAPMSQLIDYGRRVNSGEVKDPSFHLTMYAADDEDNPWELSSWKKANPALGDFRSLEDVKRLASQAQRMPAQESAFRNLILNQRISAEARFINRSEWVLNAGHPNIPVGSRVYAALDLGATRDLSALIILYQDADLIFHCQPYFWVPGNIRERTKLENIPYDAWERQGLIIPCGVTTDPRIIARKVAEIDSQTHIVSLAYDRWRINDFKRELDEIGCAIPLVPHGQGYKDMGPAVDILERIVVQGRLRHGGNPVLSMCAANAIVTKDPAGARKLDKSRSTGRIDGLVALAMAFSLTVAPREAAIDIDTLIA
jgi:phage terminase large subunit-like protein